MCTSDSWLSLPGAQRSCHHDHRMLTGFIVNADSPASPALALSKPKHRCFDILTLTSEVISALARERAVDGVLSLEQIEHILDIIKSADSPLQAAMTSQEQKCHRHFRPPPEEDANAGADVFRRMLVRPFETLLEGEHPPFPRHFLANYYEVTQVAFGGKYELYDHLAREIFQDMLISYGSRLAWDFFFDEPRARGLLRHSVTRLLRFIETPEGQWAWLICMERETAQGRASATQCDMVLNALRTTVNALTPKGQSG